MPCISISSNRYTGFTYCDYISDSPPAEVFLHYEFSTALGSGGYGVVRRALHKATGAWVAVKTINPKESARRPGATGRELAQREVTALERLRHPYIVKVIEHFMCIGDNKLCEFFFMCCVARADVVGRYCDGTGGARGSISLCMEDERLTCVVLFLFAA